MCFRAKYYLLHLKFLLVVYAIAMQVNLFLCLTWFYVLEFRTIELIDIIVKVIFN